MNLRSALHISEAVSASSHGNAAFSALIWWLVPLFAVTGAVIYVIWVSRFKDKYESETNRSVSAFQTFQRSFTGPTTPVSPASPGSSAAAEDATEQDPKKTE